MVTEKEGLWKVTWVTWVSRQDTLRDPSLLPPSLLFCKASIKCPFAAPEKEMVLPKSFSLPPSPFHIKLYIVASYSTILCASQGQTPFLNHLCATVTWTSLCSIMVFNEWFWIKENVSLSSSNWKLDPHWISSLKPLMTYKRLARL